MPDHPKLDERALVRMLLEAGMLSAESIHSGLRVSSLTRRHLIWIVRVTSGDSLVVKQALTDDGRSALAREAMLYERLSTPGSALAGTLPRLVRYDAAQHRLTIEFVDGRSLAEEIARTRRTTTDPEAALGRMLASLHRLDSDAVACCRQEEAPHNIRAIQPEVPPVASTPPWVLGIQRPTPNWYLRSSEASLHLRSAIQQSPVIGPAFDALRERWQPSALVHGDLKLHHVIVRRRGIAVIDWESTAAGDPAWDIGTVIAGCLSLWLRSIPLVGGMPDSQLIDQAAVPLKRVQPSLRSFWDAYAAGCDDPQSILSRSMEYAAARLIQLEEERLQAEPEVSRRTDLIVRVSENILLAPGQAVTVLAGIDPGHEPAG